MRSSTYSPLLTSFPHSEKINAVSIGAETLYIRLLAQCDDAARYYGHPGMILGQLFPHRMIAKQVTEADVGAWVEELIAVGLIERYQVAGMHYVRLIECFKTMRRDVKPKMRFPAPEGEPGQVRPASGSSTGRATDNGEASPLRIRNESVPDAGRVRDGCGPLDLDLDLDPKEHTSVPPSRNRRSRHSYSQSFTEGWEAYGRRGAKWPAAQQYARAIERIQASADPPEDAHAWLLDQIRAYRAAAEAAGVEERYIPHLERWLRDDRWDGDVATWQRQFAGGHSRASPSAQPATDVESTAQTQAALAEIRQRRAGSKPER